MKRCVHGYDNIIIELNRTKNIETLLRNSSCEQKSTIKNDMPRYSIIMV